MLQNKYCKNFTMFTKILCHSWRNQFAPGMTPCAINFLNRNPSIIKISLKSLELLQKLSNIHTYTHTELLI